MDGARTKKILGVIYGFLGGAALVFILFSFSIATEKPKDSSVDEQENIPLSPPTASDMVLEDFQEITDVFQPIILPLYQTQEESGALPEPGENKNEGLSQEYQVPFGQGPQSLTREGVFNRLWPPVYRDALLGLETVMINDGFMSETDRRGLSRRMPTYTPLFQNL